MAIDRTGLRFALTFAAIAALLFGIYCFPYVPGGPAARFLGSYLEGYARMAGLALGLFESGLRVDSTLIVGRTTLEIARNCDAIEVNILFASAVLAFPASLRARLIGLVSGLFALVGINLVRICSLYYLLVYSPPCFEAAHLEVWPLVLVALAAAGFVLWIRWQMPTGSASGPLAHGLDAPLGVEPPP